MPDRVVNWQLPQRTDFLSIRELVSQGSWTALSQARENLREPLGL